MDVVATKVSAAQFEAFVALPENTERLFELIGGEIVEVPSNPYSSKISARIIRYLDTFVEEHDLGHVTGEAGGYIVLGDRYAPDAAFISKVRQPELPHEGYCPNPPDLAVEVASPTDSMKHITTKVANYLAAGTVVWVVYPEAQEVAVFAPGQAVVTLGRTGTLSGGAVLPGFQLPLAAIFPAPPQQ